MDLPVLLTAAARCASATACPSDVELLDALREREVREVYAWRQALEADGGQDVHLSPRERATEVGAVRCQRPSPPNRVRCVFTYLLGENRIQEIAVLQRSTSSWVIVERLSVELSD